MDGHVTISNLEKVYESGTTRTKAIEDLPFGVDGGEFVSVVDPSGCGGSTLHYLVAGFLDVDLDRSRNREEVVASEAFAEMKNTVWRSLREETQPEVQA